MSPRILTVRVTLFWSRHFGVLLGAEAPAGAPMAFLGHRREYKALFDSLDGAASPGPPDSLARRLERPWPPAGTNRFWLRYLAVGRLVDVRGGSAWGRLVPLRRQESPAGKLQVQGLTGKDVAVAKVTNEAFFHSDAVTFAMHVTLAGEMDLRAMARACVALRTGKVFAAEGQPAARGGDLASALLAQLCRESLGPTGPALAGPEVCYSLVTVLEGDGFDPTVKIEQDSEVHRALEATTSWSPTWEINPLPSLAANTIPTRRAPAGHLVYGRQYSRTVWEPWAFQVSDHDQTALSCYHRNLFAGLMQTEALLRFAWVAESAAAAGRLSGAANELAPSVVQQVMALHAGGTVSTPAYRCDSLRLQIDQSPLRGYVDALAARLGLAERLPPP